MPLDIVEVTSGTTTPLVASLLCVRLCFNSNSISPLSTFDLKEVTCRGILDNHHPRPDV